MTGADPTNRARDVTRHGLSGLLTVMAMLTLIGCQAPADTSEAEPFINGERYVLGGPYNCNGRDQECQAATDAVVDALDRLSPVHLRVVESVLMEWKNQPQASFGKLIAIVTLADGSHQAFVVGCGIGVTCVASPATP